MFNWLIVGGGLHGTYMTRQLCERKASGIAVVDPAPMHGYADAWKRNTRNVLGLDFLRSPMERFVDDGSNKQELKDFQPHKVLSLPRALATQRFIHLPDSPTDVRPSLELFNAHIDEKVNPFIASQVTWIQAAAELIRFNKRSKTFEVSTMDSSKPIKARHVILATGQSDKTNWPGWAEALKPHRSDRSRWTVAHLFDPAFDTEAFLKTLPVRQGITIVGGGISALQLATMLSTKHKRQVTLVTRKPIQQTHGLIKDQPPRVYPLDFHPAAGKIDTALFHQFLKTAVKDRVAFNQEYRYPGSYPQDVYENYQKALKTGRLKVIVGEVNDSEVISDAKIRLTVSMADSSEAHIMEARHILLATGFDAKPFQPNQGLLGTAVQEMKLPVESGFPVVSEYLQWGNPRLFVTGALADLGVGPAARNIAGAQLAAPMILSSSEAKQGLRFGQRSFGFSKVEELSR